MNSFLENRPAFGAIDTGTTKTKSRSNASFQPLFTPGVVIPKMHPDPSAPVDSEVDSSEPKVEFVHNGGRVERIIVTCSCCNRIELKCDY